MSLVSKIKRIPSVSLLCVLSFNATLAMGQSADDELVEEVEDSNSNVSSPTRPNSNNRRRPRTRVQIPGSLNSNQKVDVAQPVEEDKVESRSSDTRKENKGVTYHIRGGYGFLQSSSEQGGKEFTASLPYENGHLRSFEFRVDSEQNFHFIRFRSQNVVFSKIPDTSPTSVDAARQHVLLASYKKLSGMKKWMQGFSLGGGLYYFQQRVQETKPFAVMTSQHASGFNFGINHKTELHKNLDLSLKSEMELPIVFKEYRNRTGAYQYGYTYEFAFDLDFEVVKWQVWSVGANIRNTAYQFSGVGEQGVKNGIISYWDYWFPIELRLKF